MQTQRLALIKKTETPDVYEITPYIDNVVSYGLADGVAVLKFADGGELKHDGVIGFSRPTRAASE